MSRRDTLKLVHFISTALFVLSVGYIFVLALWQAGKSWGFIVSLSGYSALIVFLLISFYLVAIYRGVARSQKSEIEHPLTTTIHYSFLYDISPFLGALAGALGAIGVDKVTDYLLVVAIGSFWTTFLVWIVIDPAIGLIEMLLPSSREHRRKRLAQAKAIHEKEHLAKQRLLSQVQAEERHERELWADFLKPYADRLAALMVGSEAVDENRETEVVDIGVTAWQRGGLNCMRQLHSMGMEICKQKYRDTTVIDYISIWWDGIGSWQNSYLS